MSAFGFDKFYAEANLSDEFRAHLAKRMRELAEHSLKEIDEMQNKRKIPTFVVNDKGELIDTYMSEPVENPTPTPTPRVRACVTNPQKMPTDEQFTTQTSESN